jgi:hypothetical protein
VEDRGRLLVEELSTVVEAWEDALVTADEARRRRDQVIALAQGALEKALGGLTLQRWRRLVEGDVSVRSQSAGRAVHLARRRRQEVQSALDGIEVASRAEALNVGAAEAAVADLARRLLVYGPLAERVTGRSIVELSKMAGRLPRARRPGARP